MQATGPFPWVPCRERPRGASAGRATASPPADPLQRTFRGPKVTGRLFNSLADRLAEPMIVTSLQLSARNTSKAQALEQVVALLAQAKGSDLVLLPELWPCGYFSFDRYETDSEPLDGPLVRDARDQARQHRFHLFTGSFVERDAGKLHNTCLLIDPAGEILGRYRKVHLFGYDSQERRRLTPGNEITVVPTPWGKAGLATCYDIRFPELFRAMLDRGAEMFLVTAAWPAQREDAWILFNRARAHENLAHLFSCNFADDGGGEQPKLAGRSLFVDPLGVILADAGPQPAVLTREVDMTRTAATRRDFPVLEHRVFKRLAPERKLSHPDQRLFLPIRARTNSARAALRASPSSDLPTKRCRCAGWVFRNRRVDRRQVQARSRAS